MGAVLLATDTRLDRKVAIKRILGEAADIRMAVQRFLTEAKTIAALNHPSIVQIYDYGRAKDGPFLIMEYVDVGSLLDRCRGSTLPLEEAIDLACQLCDGLAKAQAGDHGQTNDRRGGTSCLAAYGGLAPDGLMATRKPMVR